MWIRGSVVRWPTPPPKTPSPASTPEDIVSEDDVQDDVIAVDEQIYPARASMAIARQSMTDLTCGMRTLQNLCGLNIVTRQQMDKAAKDLETRSFGHEMYDVHTGYYAI